MALFSRLFELVSKIDADPDIRVVVIRGKGKSFTVGLDITKDGANLIKATSADAREELRMRILKLQDSVNIIMIVMTHRFNGGMI